MLDQPAKIQIRTISAGSAGNLSVLEASRDLPFAIKRIFYIHGVRRQCHRGFHAHKRVHQLLIPLEGRLELTLQGLSGTFNFKLSQPDEGVLIPAGYWLEMRDISPDSVIAVLASDDYDEGEYLRDYDQFLAWAEQRRSVDRVPYLDLGRDLAGARLARAAADRVIDSGIYINGPHKKSFEEKFAEYCQVRRVVGVGNGLDALTLILEALDIGPGQEVIVGASGYVATALAVTRAGARPVFVEGLPNGNLDPDALEAARTERTRAVIPTHLYGFPAEMDPINQWAARHGLKVIEDACQAHGSQYKDRPCGALGDAAAFSFYPTKNLGALGDGGCVATDDEELAEKIQKLSNYGSKVKYHNDLLGCNSRLDEMQAAILLAKLPGLDEANANRRRLAVAYEENFKDLEGLFVPQPPAGTVVNWHVYAVRVKNGRRDELAAFLDERGIGTNIHYPLPIHRQQCYTAEYGRLSFPEAEAWAAETLSLPLAPNHTPEEIDLVCRRVREFFTGAV